MKTVTIEIPDNMELIQDRGIYKLSQIKPKTWEEFCKSLPVFGEFFIRSNSEIGIAYTSNRRVNEDRNLLQSKEEAEAILALIQLIRLRKAWVGEWDPERTDTCIYYIQSTVDGRLTISFITRYMYRHTLTFPSESIAKQFMECFRDLLNKAERFLA